MGYAQSLSDIVFPVDDESSMRKNIRAFLKREIILPEKSWAIFLLSNSDYLKIQTSRKNAVKTRKQVQEILSDAQLFEKNEPLDSLPKKILLTFILLEIIVSLCKKEYTSAGLEEIENYWIPQANTHNLWGMRYIIEDILFAIQYPQQHTHINDLLLKTEKQYSAVFQDIEGIIQHKFHTLQIRNFEIQYRKKNVYGVWKKIHLKDANINNIYDVLGFRILVSTRDDCYTVANALKSLWPEYPDRFKDYIKNPKANKYQSLHLTLQCLYKNAIEFQIRSFDMDSAAKIGQANHALYKKSQENLTKIVK